MVGTFRSPFESVASACSSYARYFTSSHAAAGFFAPLGMPMMLPVT